MNDWFCKDLYSVVNNSDVLAMPNSGNTYILKSLIGEGGFGNVYAAESSRDSRQVAIKNIKKKRRLRRVTVDLHLLPTEVAYLQQSGNVFNVVRLLEWFETKDHLVLVQELPTPCIELRKYILSNSFISEPHAKDIFRQVVVICVNLISIGIFHRDIKSQNLLLTVSKSNTLVKIVDFGCADKYVKGKTYTDMNGTLSHYPPEYRHIQEYKAMPHTVWQLGILLYELIQGDIPFSRECINLSNLKYGPLVTKRVRSLISSCLKISPKKRQKLGRILNHRWLFMRGKRKYDPKYSTTIH